MRRFLHHHAKRLLFYEKSPRRLALATSVALYVAISPFLGLHTIMLVVAGWLFKLNIPVLIMVSYTVNNPWTMVPLMAGGYYVGYKILHGFLGLSVAALNPPMMDWINQYIHQYVGISDVSLWAFLLGGNLVGIMVAITMFPVLYWFFKKLIDQQEADTKQNEQGK